MKQVKRVLVVTTLIAAVAVMTAHTIIAKAVYAALPIPSGEIAAYEKAHAATVPAAVIAANRQQLAAITCEYECSNILGQNTRAIAATEAHYAEMWAQDVAAMYGYHTGASAVAAQLTPHQSEQAHRP